MTPHVKIYLACTGKGIDDFVPCEICGKRANDIHHIHGRGKGKDVISNLMALCRDHHNSAHGINHTYLHPDVMQTIHNEYLKR
jgi:5-methylcytosine-specific restriction endonuclease McrA